MKIIKIKTADEHLKVRKINKIKSSDFHQLRVSTKGDVEKSC